MSAQRVIVIGGGISGLAAAHRLAELRQAQHLPLDITLLEASDRFGGVIDTRQQDGFLLEGGPDSFISEYPWAVDLCRRLGISNELIETQPEFRRSFVVRDGRLLPVPAGLYLIAPAHLWTLAKMPLISWTGKLRMACDVFLPPRRDDADESVASFVRRRLGQEALERLGQPMISGIYTADPERLSLQATMPRFREMERRYGSVIRGIQARAGELRRAAGQASGPRYSLFLSMRGGVGTLVEALVRRMSEVNLRHSAQVERISRDSAWTVRLASGESLEADALCLALPSGRAAVLLESCAPSLAGDLATIPYESVATVNIAFRKADVPHPLNGFGFVVPAVEGGHLVGCTFSSVKFAGRAPQGMALLRAFVGGALHREVFALDDRAMETMVRDELRKALGIQAAPQFVSIRRYPQAMPQYRPGHLQRLTALEAETARYPGLALTGNGYRGIGLPDCIHQAEAAAERVAASLSQRSQPESARPAA